ncbi:MULTISPECIES: flagellar biosynthetic protein FliR [Ureibacillus]|jgi:flagellar biosynthetic protein FliR|uniref:Flagellar biosynthetic protein FliR n=1 Tax=Ureibacillus thermosphaericus TaxID=51173 RepID=A0A840PSX2_URETH|nr:flagellar biosynthetic protein FliR [Ureibacillus thermosphaericus]MBB5147861.1 flagellar biosynthetic protein FliR [Ureibacillus thermosphaericus]NKZ30337.1 flagellar type III secretion system protein FliR [Ureibacillus thermosphaericus]
MLEIIPQFSVFLLMFVRISAFFVTVPFFSYRTIPPQLKILLALMLAWMMYYTIQTEVIPIDGNYILLIMKEAMIGLIIGLAATIIISIVQIAGGFIDFEMGFAMANIVDPLTGAQSPMMGQFFNLLILYLLIATNGHHLILDGIYYSYQFIPINHFPNFGDAGMAEFTVKLIAVVFSVAFQMSAPLVAALFLLTLAIGITGKTVPQLNIFIIGFPLKIIVGFLVLFISMGIMIEVMQKVIELMITVMREFMQFLGGA